ncbi:MAG: exodeoxyribonuclease VII small subunit [Melioribacteraceae bacterium]|nr:exodeoxyribonuclease VII small subunit [Melioribacteraceae bacterium]MCO6472194.1 exodeoxyribonuclease VII small subunit [Melioribacteraceae bacterium]MDD3557436.1 exodeoxyribonuclease VII small subunit [Melioribacteraceae bacterium]
MAKQKTKTFEEALERLEEISEKLESEEVGLNESIQLYEEGILLSEYCYGELKKAEQKITKLKLKFEDSTIDESEE